MLLRLWEIKIKQRWSIIQSISRKQTTASYPKPLNTKIQWHMATFEFLFVTESPTAIQVKTSIKTPVIHCWHMQGCCNQLLHQWFRHVYYQQIIINSNIGVAICIITYGCRLTMWYLQRDHMTITRESVV